MTRNQFIEKYRHEVMGRVCEGVYVERHNEMLAKWMRATMGEMDALIGRMYDELTKPEPPPQAAQPEVKNNGKTQR